MKQRSRGLAAHLLVEPEQNSAGIAVAPPHAEVRHPQPVVAQAHHRRVLIIVDARELCDRFVPEVRGLEILGALDAVTSIERGVTTVGDQLLTDVARQRVRRVLEPQSVELLPRQRNLASLCVGLGDAKPSDGFIAAAPALHQPLIAHAGRLYAPHRPQRIGQAPHCQAGKARAWRLAQPLELRDRRGVVAEHRCGLRGHV